MEDESISVGVINYGRCFANKPIFYLNHSCDEWEIGSAEDLRKFITDAETILKKVEENQ